MEEGDPSRKGESEPGSLLTTLVASRGALERDEDALEIFGADPDASE